MTVGEIVAFTNYLRQTLFSLQMVSMLLIQISRAGASATRIAEVLERRAGCPGQRRRRRRSLSAPAAASPSST